MAQAVVAHLDGNYAVELGQHEAFSRLRHNYERLGSESLTEGDPQEPVLRERYKNALVDLILVRRQVLRSERCESDLDLEIVRRMEEVLDHEEARIQGTRY